MRAVLAALETMKMISTRLALVALAAGALTPSTVLAQELKPGPAERMGREVGPFVAGGLAGAATPAGRLSSIAVGVAGVHAVGDAGAAAGGAYGQYIDRTGNNPMLPSPISGHSPRPSSSVLDSITDAVTRAFK